MSRAWKITLAVAIYPTLIWLIAIFILAFAGAFSEESTLTDIVIYVSAVAGVVNGLAVIYGFIWVLRHLEGKRRRNWGWGFFFGGFIVAMLWWWKLVRPLPESRYPGEYR